VTNECDLSEVRHIAQQKFLELVESGAEWGSDGGIWGSWNFVRGPWSIWIALEGGMKLTLGEHKIWSKWPKIRRNPRVTSKGLPDKRDLAKIEKEAKEAKAEFEADPIVIAIRKIEKIHHDRRCEAAIKRMQDELKSACSGLQSELGKLEPLDAAQADSAFARFIRWAKNR
jgi:hypothetical protein